MWAWIFASSPSPSRARPTTSSSGWRKATEDLGFDAFFRSDHYLAMGVDGLPGPTDAWTTLAGLARETSTIRLGTLMTSATFRLPGPLAIQVAQVDQMSGGRVELGLGAGWFEEEHTATASRSRRRGERFDRLEEQLAIITGLWATPEGERFSHAGEHYTLTDSPALPKPAQRPRPPVIDRREGQAPHAGARGPLRRRVQPAVRLAGGDQRAVRPGAQGVRGHRPRPRRADVLQRAGAVLRRHRGGAYAAARMPSAVDVDDLRENGLAGSPAEVVDRIGQFAELGAERIYLQTLDLDDLDHLELVAAEVMPQL